MDTKSDSGCNFLTLNTLLRKTLAFAAENPYQTPAPQPEQLKALSEQMQQLFIFNERWQLLPDSTTRTQVEQISALYGSTQNTLLGLLYCSPPPEEAERWFDFRQEYRARVQQRDNLSQLIRWHLQFFSQLQACYPQLPVPFPTGYASTEKMTETAESVPAQQLPDDGLPEILL